jgi:hypothetical protein
MTQSQQDQRRRESPAGYHFYYSYWENPRNFYLKYVLGLKPRFTPPPLLKGGCIHEAMECYYKENYNIDGAIKTYNDEMEARRREYEDGEKFEDDLKGGMLMLSQWHQDWYESDKETLEVVEVEKPYEFWIGPEKKLKFTVRPDRVMKNLSTGKYYVHDTKTTGWSISKAIAQADSEDQLTAYLWAIDKEHPEWKVDSGIIDVMYKRKSKVETHRSDPIYRTNLDKIIFEMNIVGTIIEVTQKVKAVKSGVPWPLLFPRNGRIAGLFGDPYEALSRIDVKPGQVPVGFEKDDWSEELERLLDIVDVAEWAEYAGIKEV